MISSLCKINNNNKMNKEVTKENLNTLLKSSL